MSVSTSGESGPDADLASALSAWAAGVTLVTVADDRDDIGTTVSAFCPVSLDPPLVLVSLIAGSYPAEVLSRPSLPAQQFAVTLLSASQRMLAGRFAAAGRPSARLILDDVPHARGASSGALIPSGGLAALECSVARRVPAGDHLLVIAAVVDVPYVAESGDPLIRFRGRYPALLPPHGASHPCRPCPPHPYRPTPRPKFHYISEECCPPARMIAKTYFSA